MKKQLLIIFPDEWLSYSPTILNLVANFSDSFDIKVISFDIGKFKNKEITQKEFEFIKINCVLFYILSKFKIYKLAKVLMLFIIIKIFYHRPDEVIGVDAIGLWVAQKIFNQCHFLSLEIDENVFFRASDFERISSVLIQTPERYNYLFKSEPNIIKNVFYVQNSPRLKTPVNRDSSVDLDREKQLIYFGNVIAKHGIFKCIESISNLSDVSLTVTGILTSTIKKQILSQYRDFIAHKKVVLNERYIQQEEVIEYLSKFSIGFCFYDLELIAKQDFNYISCPSGKLFNYYAAGVPVIGSDIIGLNSVKEFQTGILLNDLSAKSIAQAIKTIFDNYQEFKKNCLKAARYFDFDSSVKSYKDYLLRK